MRGSMFIRLLAAGIFLAVASPVFAQTFNQFLVFGPSLLDSGYFKYSGGDAHFTAARANGGALTPSGGIMNTDILASRFGLTDVSVSAPGGGRTTQYPAPASTGRIRCPISRERRPSFSRWLTTWLPPVVWPIRMRSIYPAPAAMTSVLPERPMAFRPPRISRFWRIRPTPL